ncbi:hypothetical protein TraAM80_02378 [Trypanosoma rangeli]|uniref:Vacuolar protein sorting-associated protein 13 VPS13 adaptor binding domain-containing protein n=1 Tax=Trypanosoma rangeli TaxID=5698 RepID=A0A3R7L768_TRYRA|nr:uncharacterized protein TraAM80_02378 [Trypanosoma rangeli]RNF08970.1 hypothetical protein TraAM80_02378 [Trypanosoma rangeli]|eukprot:RNF08970.1 hypothetical protein TraAM80_02378 [Trypanosoma rangeli]
MSKHVTPSPLPQRQSSGSQSFISPFGAMACVQYQPVPYRTDLPAARIDLHLAALCAALSREEWATLCALWREIRDGEEYDVLRQFRPVGTDKRRPTDNARAWWVYAIHVTLHRIRRYRERRVFVWEDYKHLKAAREEYMTLFKRTRRGRLGANWLSELTMQEALRLRELEIELPIESIKLARRLAYHRARLEREHRDIILEKRRQQKQEAAEEKTGERECASIVGNAMDMDQARGKGGSSWWSWSFFSRTRNTACEALDEDVTDLQAEVEEMFQLVYAERWTLAQRHAIAKEFGIPESEVESLSDVGGTSHRSLGELQWQVYLHISGLELMLCESTGERAPFATLAIERFNANLAYMFIRRFSFNFSLDEYVVLAHLAEKPRAVSVIRVARERCVTRDSENVPAMLLFLKRHYAGSLAEYDAETGVMPYEIGLEWGPMDCNLDASFLQACIEFARPPSATLFSSLSAALPATLGGVRPSCERRQETMDSTTQRAVLMMRVEREFLCSWRILLHDVRIVASEAERQLTRIRVEQLEVRNDPAKKLERRRRIQTLTGISDTFGDDADHWVNTVHVTVEGLTAESLLNPVSADASVYGDKDDKSEKHWERVMSLPSFTLCVKKSVMMQRSPSVPFFSASLMFAHPLQFRCSRQSLSVLCNFFSLMTDICQRIFQLAATNTVSLASVASPSMIFHAQVLTVDERYFVEHEPSPWWKQEQFYREKMQAPEVIDTYRRVELATGKMILYHGKRPSFPSHFFELCRGHLHIAQYASEVSLFLESGGISHEYRRGVLKAKEVLFGKYKFPPLGSMSLLEALVEEWCQAHTDSREEEEEEEVKRAFRIIYVASRTRPCRHLRVRLKTAEEAQHFVNALNTHAVGYHAMGIPPDPTPAEEAAESQKGAEHHLRLFTLDMSIPKCTFLLLDEAIENQEDGAAPPAHEVLITAVNLFYVQKKRKKLINFAINGLSVTAHARTVPVVEVTKSAATPPVSDFASAAMVNADTGACPAINILFQMKERVYPHLARKYMKLTASAEVKLEFSSELMNVVEMLWDITGIMTNQIYGYMRYQSVPWSDETAASIEEKWRADPAGALLQNNDLSIALEHLVLSLYYPTDRFELADKTDVALDADAPPGDSSGDMDDAARGPVTVIDGSHVRIHWSNTEGCNKTYSIIHNPRIMMRTASTGELVHVVIPTRNHREEKTTGRTLTSNPTLSLSFSIHHEPPMLSRSDFIANGGPSGYRYTHFVLLSGTHLNVVYWQSQLWSLIEVFSRGVISRATWLVWRQPYTVGTPLLRWPQPDAPPAPFSWNLLHKHVELSHVQLLLPDERAHFPATRLWGKFDLCRFHDTLVIGGESDPASQKRCVQHISTLTLEGLEIQEMRRKFNINDAANVNMVTLLSRTSFLLEFSYELFRVDGWNGTRPRRFRVEMPENVVFQGTTHQFLLLVDWFFVNYMEEPWRARFLPNTVAIDPFLLAYGAGEELTEWTVDIPYACFHLKDPPRLYHCVEDEVGSLVGFERSAIDLAVVIERFKMELQWRLGDGFLSRHSVGEVSVWQLEPLLQNRVEFRCHPKEVVDDSFRFLWFHNENRETAMSPTKVEEERQSMSHATMNEDMAIEGSYEVNFKNGDKLVSSRIAIHAVDITPEPYFLFNLKDSLFSLYARNAYGQILRWESRVAGVPLIPPDPALQDYSTNHHFTLVGLNVVIPKLLCPRQRVMPLFVASIKSIEFVSSSEKYGANCAWSISVDSITQNGLVVDNNVSGGGWKLTPLFVPPFCSENDTEALKAKQLLSLTCMAEHGLMGTVDSLWIAIPLKREIHALCEVFEKGGYKELCWLWTFLEERRMWRNGGLRSQASDALLSVHVTIKAPCVVMPEHGGAAAGSVDFGRGVVFSPGDILVARDTKGESSFGVSLAAMSVRLLQKHPCYVIKPTRVDVSGYFQGDAMWELQLNLHAIMVEVEQSLYELLLHSLVQNFVAIEAEFFDTCSASVEDTALCLRLPLGDPTVSGSGDVPASVRGSSFGIRVCVEWESFTLRVLRNNVGFFLQMGEMSAMYDLPAGERELRVNPTVARRVHINLNFITLGADNRPNLLDMRPTATVSSCLTRDSSGEKQEEEDESVGILPSYGCLSFCLDACSKGKEEIQIDFGRAVVLLEKSTMHLLLSTIYEPYRRIVLQEYHVHDVRSIDGDITLQERLVLSQRNKVRVVQGRYNHITIDGNGHDIYFIDARSPLLSLGDGLTLCIINARIHLYGKVLEYYMAVGNGSYVIADSARNVLINEAPQSCGEVRTTAAGPESNTLDFKNGEDETASSPLRCNSKGRGSGNTKDNVLGSSEVGGCRTNSVTRRVTASAVLLLTLPEGTDGLHVAPQKSSHTAQFSRSLVLQATMSVEMEMTISDSRVMDGSSTFDMSEFVLYSKYLDADGSLMETRPLVSEWALTVHHTQSRSQLENLLKQHVEVHCPHDIEVQLRYGDVYLCWDAVLQARQAIGHIEKNVLDDVVGSEVDSSLETPQYTSQESNGTTQVVKHTSLSFNLRYFSVDVVDDSSDVNIPLFRARIDNLVTPKVEKKGLALKLHVSFTCSIIYYNFSTSAWCSLLEPVLLDFVLRSEPNLSLEDVRRRKGYLRVGLHLRPVRLHFSARVLENVRRVWLLKKGLEDAGHAFEQDTLCKPHGAMKQQFCMYRVTQHFGHNLEIRFAHNSHDSLCKPSILNANEIMQFNFPRVEGHELPLWKHRLLVSFLNKKEVVSIAKTGKHLIFRGPGLVDRNLLVDVTVSGGQKLVEFRTNITFKNELPFSMDVAGVGLVPPGGVLYLPVHCLRRRTSFMPYKEGHCSTSCSLGVAYDMLPFLHEQVFLGVCRVDCNEILETSNSVQASTSLRQSVFFCLRFSGKKCIGTSDVIDCRGTFEAPFMIVNGTSLPMRIRLLYRRETQKQNCSLLVFEETNSHEQVTTIDVASGERSCITQVTPLKDIYIDVFVAQANGEAMGQTFRHSGSSPSPALVRSVSKRVCDRTITLHDQRGASIILHLDYVPRVVTIWCPYWIINRTPHCLRVADVKNGALTAGLCSEHGITPAASRNVIGGINSDGPAYLLNTKRMEKLGDKAVIYVSIGRYISDSDIQWTKWSDKVPIGPLRESGILDGSFREHVNLSLSYTVEFVGGRMKATRVVTFSPRWILQNCTDNTITSRQCGVKANGNTNFIPRSVELAPSQSQVIDFSRGGNAANSIQVRLSPDEETGIQRSYWSHPLKIDKLSERAFNVHYELQMKVQGGCCVYPDDTVIQIGDVSCFTRAVSDVLMVSCHTRGGTMFVVVSRPHRPPLVVENRTRYKINVRQRGVSQLVVVYPRTTRGLAWEDSKSQPVMELWEAENRTARIKPLLINFEPQAVLRRSEQLQQTLSLPDGVILFVRVRGLSRTSYAISITTENTIDTFCSLPYFQFFLRVKVDSIYALLSDDDEDFILLTVKPVMFFLSQGKEAKGHGDEQVFDFSVSVIQVDDGRLHAKQRVVAQLVDSRPSTIHFLRNLFRTTPILCLKEFVINLSSVEVHLEDSFIFQAMKCLDHMRAVLGNESLPLSSSRRNEHLLASRVTGNKRSLHAKEVWKQQVVFIDHLLIEETMVSISLYRSPGALNDPMWEQLGYLSLFIRSVRDARFVWRRIEQWGVYETLWLLGASYSSFYKHKLQQQMSNVVHVAGLDMMRGFVTDLLQGYFSSAIVTNIDRSKLRIGRRAEAHFADDEKSLGATEGVAVTSHNIFEDMLNLETAETVSRSEDGGSVAGKGIREEAHGPHLSLTLFNTKPTCETGGRIIEAAMCLPWSAFCARVSDSELCIYGVFAVKRFLRNLDFANTFRMQWQMQDLTFKGTGVSGTSTVPRNIGHCESCAQIEMMREQRFKADSPSALPHPDSGLITWAEFVHHISWSEFVQLCSPSEVRQYAGLVMFSLVGEPINMIRIDGDKELRLNKEIA